MTTAFDDYEHAPLGDRQWYFGDIGGYVYTDTHGRRGRWVAIIGAVGMSAATTRHLAALLIEAADTLEADGRTDDDRPPLNVFNGLLADSLSVNEFAALIHVHRATVERLLKNGEVDYVRIGNGRGRIRIPRRAAVDYINRHHHGRPD